MAPVEVPQLDVARMARQGAVIIARRRPSLVWRVASIGCHPGRPANGPSRYGTIPGDPDRVGARVLPAYPQHRSRCCAALTAPRHLLTQLDRNASGCLLVQRSCDFAGANGRVPRPHSTRTQLLDHSAQRRDHGSHELSFRRLLPGHGHGALHVLATG